MSPLLKDTIYVFAHIPKTGGTSLRTHFQNHLRDQEEFIHLSEKGMREAENQNLCPFGLRDIEAKSKVKVILGHDVNHQTGEEFSEKNLHRVVVFRPPSSWLISRYNQAIHERIQSNRKMISFPEWIEKYPNIHSQFNWFAAHYLNLKRKTYDLSLLDRNKLVLLALKKFHSIISLSELNVKVSPILHSLNIPDIVIKKNVSSIRQKKHYAPNKENQEIIKSITQSDNEFFKKIPFT